MITLYQSLRKVLESLRDGEFLLSVPLDYEDLCVGLFASRTSSILRELEKIQKDASTVRCVSKEYLETIKRAIDYLKEREFYCMVYLPDNPAVHPICGSDDKRNNLVSLFEGVREEDFISWRDSRGFSKAKRSVFSKINDLLSSAGKGYFHIFLVPPGRDIFRDRSIAGLKDILISMSVGALPRQANLYTMFRSYVNYSPRLFSPNLVGKYFSYLGDEKNLDLLLGSRSVDVEFFEDSSSDNLDIVCFPYYHYSCDGSGASIKHIFARKSRFAGGLEAHVYFPVVSRESKKVVQVRASLNREPSGVGEPLGKWSINTFSYSKVHKRLLSADLYLFEDLSRMSEEAVERYKPISVHFSFFFDDESGDIRILPDHSYMKKNLDPKIYSIESNKLLRRGAYRYRELIRKAARSVSSTNNVVFLLKSEYYSDSFWFRNFLASLGKVKSLDKVFSEVKASSSSYKNTNKSLEALSRDFVRDRISRLLLLYADISEKKPDKRSGEDNEWGLEKVLSVTDNLGFSDPISLVFDKLSVLDSVCYKDRESGQILSLTSLLDPRTIINMHIPWKHIEERYRSLGELIFIYTLAFLLPNEEYTKEVFSFLFDEVSSAMEVLWPEGMKDDCPLFLELACAYHSTEFRVVVFYDERSDSSLVLVFPMDISFYEVFRTYGLNTEEATYIFYRLPYLKK